MQHTARLGVTNRVTVTSSSASYTTFSAQTYQVRLCANTACHIRVYDSTGTSTATTSDPFLPANVLDYLTVSPGQSVSAVQAASNGLVTSTNGSLWVTEITG